MTLSGFHVSTSHFMIKCSCGNVIAQCRCPSPSKSVEIRQHPACGMEVPANVQAHWTGSDPLHRFGRRFISHRRNDPLGVSGTGIVACGIQFENGQCVLYWLTEVNSVGIYPSMEALEQIHGHGGDTVIEWIDQ